jgi:hypothetical protein
VAKVTPNVQLSASQTSTVVIAGNGSNACVRLDGSMSTDPDGDTLTFNWLVDGGTTPVATGAVANNCLELGTHHVVLLVDDGRCSGSASVTVEVLTAGEAVDALIDDVNNADLGRSNKRPLIASLKAAIASLDRGSCESGKNQLHAFVNKVRAQIARSNPAVAADLTSLATAIIDAIDCP